MLINGIEYEIKPYANLFRANLSRANLQGARLMNTNLYDADLQGANLQGANLMCTDLMRANLMRANLRGVNLMRAQINYCRGNNREIKSLHILDYDIVYTKEVLAIGCQQHTIEEWRNFTAEQVEEFALDAGALWEKHREYIFNTIEQFPAEG